MAETIITQPVPYHYTNAEAIHVESGVDAEFKPRTCVPLALANITSGGDISTAQAYHFWHARITAKKVELGFKPSIEQDGTPDRVTFGVLIKDLGWRGFQAKRRHPKRRLTVVKNGWTRKDVTERFSVAEVARKFGTAVVMLNNPGHALAVKGGELYDAWNSQLQRDGKRHRKAFNIIQPTPAALDRVRQMIRDEAPKPKPRKRGKRAIPAEQAALF